MAIHQRQLLELVYFPGEFILGEGIEQVVGWGLAGLVMAALVKPAAR